MLEKYILHILGILAIGDVLYLLIANKYGELDLLDRYLSSITLGYSTYILPSVILSFFFDNLLSYVVYAHFALSQLCLLYKIMDLFRNLENFSAIKLEKSKPEKIALVSIILMLLGYLMISLIYPERGWDALHFYFPNGLYFYLVDDIPAGLNPFSFFPTFKPPLNSLIIAYVFYLTGGMFAHLHPWIFLTGTTVIVYKFANQLHNHCLNSMLTTILFLSLPITYFLIYEFAYYQELPLMFFLSVTLYFLKKTENPNPIIKLLASLSFALTILSKLTGYALAFIILASFKIKYINKIFQIVVVGAITLFLFNNSTTKIYLGIGLFVLLIGIVLMTLIYVTEGADKLNLKDLILIAIFPILIGIIWGIFMFDIPNIKDGLLDRYLYSEGEFSLIYPATTAVSKIYIENGMIVSFFASIFFIFTSTLFSFTLSVFKILGSYLSKNHLFFLKWILSFSLLFYGYHANVSGRYLVPIIVPLVILISIGISKFLKSIHLTGNYRLLLFYSVLILSSYLLYFPFIPISILDNSIHVRLFRYYNSQQVIIIYMLLFGIFFKLIAKKISKLDFSSLKLQRLVSIFFIITILIPFSPQIYGLASNGFNVDDFQEEMVYYKRKAYTDIIEIIQDLDLRLDERIISVNTPGLEYYVQRGVIDLLIIKGESVFNTTLSEMSFEEALDFIDEYNIRIVIHLNSDHVFYPVFVSEYLHLNLIKLSFNSTLYSVYFQNSEFVIYQRNEIQV